MGSVHGHCFNWISPQEQQMRQIVQTTLSSLAFAAWTTMVMYDHWFAREVEYINSGGTGRVVVDHVLFKTRDKSMLGLHIYINVI